ncbi:hypothetical protein [Xanthomonas campestris]|uniref:hypothetical protein n=1 Tax=Xanthomonas campestris TaxID=339 RepID=UPI002B2322D0|nr:hypothetical protein [Xanthomonas campestris]MEA9755516.1 hypothetical protein [Xanthomonas campestris pv. raphani]MEA9761985.1 hypothetical protein [Xanthomonas campestris pv. raphani]MEA9814589.1 hypothetical protein [Xanthomonas campestris pv. raphani]MEA9907722.1 hypothetical protein [Xanthomonas campestris pv. raphani]MEA9924343.1 hypothetical protein [Xanthomonas campestris pv. raphani]
MNVQTDRAKKPHSVRSKLRTLVLVAGCTVCLNGQAVTFIDPANLVENFTQRVQSAWQFAKDNSQYAKEAQYFIDQARRWKQQYDAAMAMIDLQSYRSMLPGGIKLEKIDDEYMVKERCGGEAPNVFSISGLKEIITSKVEETLNSEGIDKQQKKTCAYIQMLKNKRYNDSIDFIEKTMPAFQLELDRIVARGRGNNTPGQVSARMFELKALSNAMDIQMSTWTSRNQAYETYIVLMEDKQKSLATQALRGKEVLLGTVVKNLALRAALKNEQTK